MVLRLMWTANWSPPSRGRGLKSTEDLTVYVVIQSPPSRGRGLKFLGLVLSPLFIPVAPLAGAWIEIRFHIFYYLENLQSPPSRGRGLKFPIHHNGVRAVGRPPRGGVD